MEKDDLKCCGNCSLRETRFCKNPIKFKPEPENCCKFWEWDRLYQEERMLEFIEEADEEV